MGSVRRRWIAVLYVASVAVAGCASDAGSSTTPETGSRTSSPFSVGEVPAGYELVTAGMGTRVGEWGDDSTGTVEPYTVLSPDGHADHPDVVLVSITGFEGYEGGLAQAAGGYLSPDREELTIDGTEAMYSPATQDARGAHWADLVVVRRADLAVRVSSPSASKAELTSIAARVVVPDDHTKAPTVPDPPQGLRVVGSVDVDGVLAADASVAPHTDQIPGPRSAHAAGWVRAGSDEADHLAVLTVPGASLDLVALSVRVQPDIVTRTSHERTVDGRPGLVLDEAWEGYSVARRSVFLDAGWGDVVVVSATGETVPAEEELVTMAASVQPTDDASWERFLVEAAGGPGVHADPDRHELARGRIGELEWLLQDGPPGGGIVSSSETDPHSLRGVDPCLKLSDRRRACTGAGFSGTEDDWYAFAVGGAPDSRGLSFVIVSTTVEAATLRITRSTSTGSAALVPVPAGGLWGAVVFVDDPGGPVCDSGTPAPHQMRIELLDPRGTPVGCLSGSGVTSPVGA